MNTQKVAITIPSDIVAMIDDMSRQRKMSRSKLISMILRERLMNERDRHLKDTYDRVFSDKAIIKEQLETARWLERSGNKLGQEW